MSSLARHASHRYQIDGLRLPLGEPLEHVHAEVARRLGCRPGDWLDLTVLKRSLDARGSGHPRYDLRVGVVLPGPLPSLGAGVRVYEERVRAPLPEPSAGLRQERIVIVGAGPAGLFAALTLAERGIRCTILDRGEAVEARAKSVSRLMGKRQLDPESNLCFGEGGAGTWSDGKLYSRIGGQEAQWVLERMVELGAPGEILVERRPHLGTDRLVSLLKGIRAHLLAEGTEFRFGERVVRVEAVGRRGILHLASGERLEADRVILAVGHSARDLYRSMRDGGVLLEPQPFAVGFRVEHPQQLINEIQLGACAQRMEVPAAEYRVAFKGDRTQPEARVYSFCMCPGGSVVPTPTCEGQVCVNGMSHAARSGHYANSALVTSVGLDELADGGDPVLAGVRFQEACEAVAYALGGGGFVAPAARLVDYVAGRASHEVRRTTYRCGVQAADLRPCFPAAVHTRLLAGMRAFERSMRGFISEEAVLIGVETRTSSPLRIPRDDSGRSLSHRFLYPCGEGAGYAGGITSAAVDGARLARWILGGL